LFGHSWGSMLATYYLSKYPKQIKSLILSGPGPILPIRSALARQPAPDSLALRNPKFSNREGNAATQNLRSEAMHYIAHTFGKKLASDNEADAFFTHLNEALQRSTTCNGEGLDPYPPGGGYYAHVRTIQSFQVPDRRAQLQPLQTPVLLLKGQCDNQPWGYTQEYLDLFEQARLVVIPDGGHGIREQDQERYLKAISGSVNQNLTH
ncbi:MAG: alpha/beta hydrolase, partial [Phaeodactylibacter sp.]|nr:alpha/beta hydrolase [Phaeodactylibacter sp.]